MSMSLMMVDIESVLLSMYKFWFVKYKVIAPHQVMPI